MQDKGEISHEVAEALALKEFEKFSKLEDKVFTSDFDLFVKNTKRIDKRKSK